MIYEWGSNRRFGVDANVVGTAVEQLAKKNGGVCPPNLLVQNARSSKSPLHPLFTWDNKVAADKWRKHEARSVIASLHIVIEDSDARPPAFVHVRMTRDDGEQIEGYAETLTVIADDGLREQAIAEAVSALRGLRNRYESLSELTPVWQALDDVELKVSA